MNPTIHLIQLAGGRGLRAGGGPGSVPKQFLDTGRGLLFTVSLRAFLAGQQAFGFRVGSVVVAAPEEWKVAVAAAMADLLAGQTDVPWAQAAAGHCRAASTWNALSVLASGDGDLAVPEDSDLAVIHDAARPFATGELLGRLVAAAGTAGGAIPGIPVHDTVVRVQGEGRDPVVEYLRRDALLAVQTPQVFRWDHCLEAHRMLAGQEAGFTDDGGLLAARGHPPVVVDGEVSNWKVTTEADWKRARDILKG